MRAKYLRLPVVAAASLLSAAALAQQTDQQPPAAAGGASPPAAGGAAQPAPAPEAGAPAGQPKGATPAQPGADTQLPDVQVIQNKPKQPKVFVKKQAAKKKAPVVTPAVQPPPAATTDGVGDTAGAEPTVPAFGQNIRMSPLGGSEIPITKVPGGVSTVSATQISGDGVQQLQEVLLKRIPGIVVSDAAGNPLRAEISYRGFDASPVNGRAQGLAVYQNGVRINESFGDTVNLDVIPTNAIQGITIVSGNPVFGLNAIGGALSILMKDGFNYQGAEIDVMGGSFGRGQIGVQAGAQSGNAAAYIAGEYVKDEGFRDFSESELQRLYADIGLKGSMAEFHLSLTAADNSVGVTAAAPVELLADSWRRTFTSPQVTDIEVFMPTLSGTVKASDTLSFSGLVYYRRFKSNVIDGNLTEVEECDPLGPTPGFLCLEEDGIEEPVEDANGNMVPVGVVPDPLGSIERINTSTRSYGTSLQAVDKSRLFGLPNQFLIGASYDHGNVRYNTSSELGTIGDRFVVTGSGIILSEPDDVAPRALATANDYYGLYFSNTLDLTDQFSLTLGGRYNYAVIRLEDLTGEFPELTTTNDFQRFNPQIGGTYEILPGMSLYAGYSEANRAPTAAELGCAEPTNPCLIESFLTDDPPLKQVVSHTSEVGLRNITTTMDGNQFAWSVGYFRTLNTDDILNVVSSASSGRGFFLNAGDTLRQGVEVAASYQTRQFEVYGSYVFVDATFQDSIVLPAPNTPDGTAPCPPPGATENCNYVLPGDNLPGIPQHRFKAGFEYWLTPEWKFGADLIAISDQFFFGDEANNNRKLGAYSRVDLHTSYDITENVQVYGLVRNLFDRRYGLYGTFFDTDEAEDASTEGFDFDDPRTISPSMPFAAYGGVKVRF